MTGYDLTVAILLALGVAVALIASLGLLVLPSALQRLHVSAPVTGVSSTLVVAAFVIAEGATATAGKAILAAIVLAIGNSVLSHATARACRIESSGDWRLQKNERAHQAEPGEDG